MILKPKDLMSHVYKGRRFLAKEKIIDSLVYDLNVLHIVMNTILLNIHYIY